MPHGPNKERLYNFPGLQVPPTFYPLHLRITQAEQKVTLEFCPLGNYSNLSHTNYPDFKTTFLSHFNKAENSVFLIDSCLIR